MVVENHHFRLKTTGKKPLDALLRSRLLAVNDR
jgi:hypothetical protein